MIETPQEYTARIIGYVGKNNPLAILSSTPKKIRRLVSKSKKKALYKKPSPKKWSVAEIIAHLAETELVMAWRYRSSAEKNKVMIQPFEQDDWAKNSRYHKSDIDEMLTVLSVVRKANLKFLTNLPNKKLKNFGMHQERGKETISHMIRLEAGHDINHLKQIKSILSSNSKKKS